MNKYENIFSERLMLVPLSMDYLQEIFANFTDEVTKYMLPETPKAIFETEAFITSSISAREEDTSYTYAVTLSENNEFIGCCGLHKIQDEYPELGIWTKTSAHGNHYGREAVGALITLAKDMGIPELIYPVDRRNIASKKIPLFYGGKLLKKAETNGKLEIEIYKISLE